MTHLFVGALALGLLTACRAEKQNKELVRGCESVIEGLEHCFPGREDVKTSLRESFRIEGKNEQEVSELEETCRVESARLAKDCP